MSIVSNNSIMCAFIMLVQLISLVASEKAGCPPIQKKGDAVQQFDYSGISSAFFFEIIPEWDKILFFLVDQTNYVSSLSIISVKTGLIVQQSTYPQKKFFECKVDAVMRIVFCPGINRVSTIEFNSVNVFSMNELAQDLSLVKVINIDKDKTAEGAVFKSRLLQGSNQMVFFVLMTPNVIKKYQNLQETAAQVNFFISPFYSAFQINIFDVHPIDEQTVVLGCLGGLIILYDFANDVIISNSISQSLNNPILDFIIDPSRQFMIPNTGRVEKNFLARIFQISDCSLVNTLGADRNLTLAMNAAGLLKQMIWLPQYDNRYILVATEINRLQVYNVNTGNVVRIYQFQFEQRILKMMYKENTKEIIVLIGIKSLPKDMNYQVPYYRYENILTYSINWALPYETRDPLLFNSENAINMIEAHKPDTLECLKTCGNSRLFENVNFLRCENCLAECETCIDQDQCSSCRGSLYLNEFGRCTDACENGLFGETGSASTENPLFKRAACVNVCQSDEYLVGARKCYDSKTLEASLEIPKKGISFTTSFDQIKTNQDKNNRYYFKLKFDRAVFENPDFQYSLENCIEFKYLGPMPKSGSKVTMLGYASLVDSDIALVNFTISSQVGLRNPQVSIRFKDQRCIMDKNKIVLTQAGLLPFQYIIQQDIIQYDEQTLTSTKAAAAAAQGGTDSTATVGFPLMLTNVMFVFWIIINVFQIINLFLFLNVRYPINLSTFFRIFQTFNLDFIPNVGSEYDNQKNVHEVFGSPVVDQKPPQAFQRESMSANFFTNGTKYLMIFIGLLFVLALLRGLKQAIFSKRDNTSIANKIFYFLLDKIEYTLIFTTNNSAILMFSVGICLQLRCPSGENAVNVMGYILAIIALIYFIGYIAFNFRGINRMGKIVGTQSMEAVPEWKDHFQEYKIKYEVLYYILDHIYFFNRNFLVMQSVRNFFISLFIVALHDYPTACIVILMIFFFSTAVFLLIKKPFEDTLVNYVYAVNEILLTLILVLILVIHATLEAEGDKEISVKASDKVVSLGWVIIGIIFALFVFDVVTAILIEWKNIQQMLEEIKLKAEKAKNSQETIQMVSNKSESDHISLKRESKPANKEIQSMNVTEKPKEPLGHGDIEIIMSPSQTFNIPPFEIENQNKKP